MANLVLMDYANNQMDTGFCIDDLSNVFRIDIKVVTGDEIAEVMMKNGKKYCFDSSSTRMMDFFDDEYCIFSPSENHLDDFDKRTSSYDLDWLYGYEMEKLLETIPEEED